MPERDMSRSEESECIPREQLEVALQLMEEFHGSALRRPWSDEAHAYYHAIDAIEGALNEEFDPDACGSLMDIRRSRKAREQGYAEATLLDERFGTIDDEPVTLTGKIMELFR